MSKPWDGINPSEYVIIDDGAYRYPVQKSDLRPGDTPDVLRAMNDAEYQDWCQEVPADFRFGELASEELGEFMDYLIDGGAEVWRIV